MPSGTQNAVGFAPKQAFVTSLTSVATSTEGDLEGVGTTRVDQYGKRYRWITNEGDTASKAGAPACFDAANIADADFLQAVPVEDIAAADTEYFAGVWMAAVPAAGFGWIQTFGLYDPVRLALASADSAAIGEQLIPSTSTTTTATGAGAAYAFVVGQTAGTVLSTTPAVTFAQMSNPCAICMETVASGAVTSVGTAGGDAHVFIKGFMP